MAIKYYSIPDPSNKLEVSILAQFKRFSEKNGMIFTFKPVYENQDPVNVWFPYPSDDKADWHKTLKEGAIYKLTIRFITSGISASIRRKEILFVEQTELNWDDENSWHSGITLDVTQMVQHMTCWSEHCVSEITTPAGKAFVRTTKSNHAASLLTNSVCLYLDFEMRDYIKIQDKYDIRQAWDEENHRPATQPQLVWKL